MSDLDEGKQIGGGIFYVMVEKVFLSNFVVICSYSCEERKIMVFILRFFKTSILSLVICLPV